MRAHLALLMLSVILFALSIPEAKRFNELNSLKPGEFESKLRVDFARNREPLFTVKLSEVLELRADPTLIDPSMTLPQTHRYPFAQISSLNEWSESCHRENRVPITEVDLKKLETWIAFVCKDLANLPARFFQTPPYMHPSGKSYAALAVKHAEVILTSETKTLFHLFETSQSTSSLETTIRALGPETVAAMLTRQPWIEGARFVAASERDERSEFAEVKTYLVHDRVKWDKALSEGASDPSVHQKRAAILNGVAVFLLALNICWLLVATYRSRKKDYRRRLFNLQVLSHELRTPVAAMKLDLERFNDLYDRLPSEIQISFLRLSQNLGRLGRVLEASQSYLRLQGNSKLSTQIRTIGSMNGFMDALLEEFGEQVRIQSRADDFQIASDEYWLSFCVHNLITNALRHGQLPIDIEWRKLETGFVISVRDGGELSVDDYRRLQKPFRRHDQSGGLGLGLGLVAQVARKLGGELEFAPSPTTFSLKFRSET